MIPLVPSALSVAEGVMVRLCRLPGPSRRDGDQPLPDAVSREELVRTAGAHAVLGLCLAEGVRREAFAHWPDSDVADASRTLSDLRRQAALWDLERDRLITLLGRRGIEPVILKGSALRALVYREPVGRAIGDLDMLVERESHDAALDALADAGYVSGDPPEVQRALRAHHFHDRLRGPGGFAAELHWSLQPGYASFALPVEKMLARSTRSESGAGMRVFTAEDMLLHIVSQSIEDRFTQLRRIVDVDRIVRREPELDWEAYVRRAEVAGLCRMSALALDLSHALLGAPIPEDVVARLRPPRRVQRGLRLLSTTPVALKAARERRLPPGDALRIVLIDDRKARRQTALRLFAGRSNPIEWVFQKGADWPPRFRGPRRAAKLVGFLLVAGAIGALIRFSRAGRDRWRECARALPYGVARAGG